MRTDGQGRRVGVIALLQESNTFISQRTTFDKFEEDILLTGEAVRERFADTHHEVGGFFEGLAQAGIEAVPIFAARALPFGMITADAYERLTTMLFDEVGRAGSLDGYLVAPHGATVSEVHRDADGYWLSRLREIVVGSLREPASAHGASGLQCPIIATADPHANLSQRMVDAVDAITAYRTNPHIDQRERGLEAAALMARTFRGEVRPTTAAAFPPLAINIERQHSSEPPCRPLYEHADEIRRRPGVLSVSIFLGYPYADVEEMGSSVVVVTDDDPELARRLVDELAQDMWDHRQDFAGRFISIDEALDRAADLPGPVCLLDMGDNVGGGSPADGTWLAHAMHERRIGNAFVCLCDPEAVQQAEAAGVGQGVRLRVGGKTDDRHGPPLEAEFTVLSLSDGVFHESEVRHGGFTHYNQGRTAVVRTQRGLTVMLTSRRMVPFSLAQLTSCGLDPSAFHLLVAKGVNAPLAAYEKVCRRFIRVNTPGSTTADITQLEYHHRRRPMFPFEV